MASLLTSSNILLSSSSRSSRKVIAALPVPKLPARRLSVPTKEPARDLVDGFRNADTNNVSTTTLSHEAESFCSSMATTQLYAILEAVVDRVEMHNNMGEQRQNWNNLLLNSINMITISATMMAGVAAAGGCVGASASLLGLKLASTILFSSAAGMLVIMNKIQPSQLAEEQRNATRLFKQLQSQIQTLLALGSPTKEDVKEAMDKVLALDKAYPLPLLGAMLEKFPKTFQPAVWWPTKIYTNDRSQKTHDSKNGWSEELEMEMREIVEVTKRKDLEDYERLGNVMLKTNKVLAVSGPLLTGIAAVGCASMGSHGGSWGAVAAAVAGALATTVNTLEHGVQVGMVHEMYRFCAGFFRQVEESVESTLEEGDAEKRENGELFEMKMGLRLGRSLSELRDLAKRSSYGRVEGTAIDEFASKLF